MEVDYTAEEREAHKLLRRYGEGLAKTVAGTKREFGSQFVLNLLKKRLFSSPRAFAILTATPHNGYQESFTSLLELLDDQRFARNIMPEEKQP